MNERRREPTQLQHFQCAQPPLDDVKHAEKGFALKLVQLCTTQKATKAAIMERIIIHERIERGNNFHITNKQCTRRRFSVHMNSKCDRFNDMKLGFDAASVFWLSQLFGKLSNGHNSSKRYQPTNGTTGDGTRHWNNIIAAGKCHKAAKLFLPHSRWEIKLQKASNLFPRPSLHSLNDDNAFLMARVNEINYERETLQLDLPWWVC